MSQPVFEVMEKYGVGQVLSHWTWLPPLSKQFEKANGKAFNSEKSQIVRLITPIGMRYEETYAKAHPFDKLVEGMLQSGMVQDTVDIMRRAVDKNIETFILINNRAGGNVPLIAQAIVDQLVSG